MSGAADPAWQLTAARLVRGVWTARLDGAGPRPEIAVTHHGTPLDGVTLIEADSGWQIRVPLPPETLSDGVQTYLVTDTASGAALGALHIAAGDLLAPDLTTELSLLRAELDLLKRAFRRHCAAAEGGGPA